MPQDARSPFGKDVYQALASVGWESGVFHARHADAIVRLALEEGLDFEEVLEIEEAIRHPMVLGAVDVRALSKSDRLFVYAVAAWIAGVCSEPRSTPAARAHEATGASALERLGEALKVDARARCIVEGIVRKIEKTAEAAAGETAEQGAGARSSRLDTRALRRTIRERVSAAEQRRASNVPT